MSTLKMGKFDLEYPGPYLGDLREATALLGDADALRSRMEEDGYLLIRGLLNTDLVREARLQLVSVLAEEGALDPDQPKEDAVVAPNAGGGFRGGDNALTRCPAFRHLVESDEVMGFF